MQMRLSQVAKILNKGLSSVAYALQAHGHKVEINPNTQINLEQLEILAKEFKSNELLNGTRRVEQSNRNNTKSTPTNLPNFSNTVQNSEIQNGLLGLKIVGRIDLTAKPVYKSIKKTAISTELENVDKPEKTTLSHLEPINTDKGKSEKNNGSIIRELDVLDEIQKIRQEKGIPNFIYKYFTINDNFYASIRGSYLFYNNPKNFNDPFDCSTRLVFFIENFKQYRSELRAKKNPLAKKLDRALFQRLRTTYKEALNEAIEGVGITCFSRKPLNMLMWSHYSCNHTGVCLEFKYDADSNIYSALDVYYADKLIATNIDKKPEIAIGNMTYTKAKDWEYEQELRIQKVGLKSIENRKIPFNKEALTKVIFGVKCSPDSINSIKSLVNESNYPNVKFYRVFHVEGKFSLEMREL